MKQPLYIFSIILSFLSFSQGYNPAMPVSKSDLELQYYAKDSTANALVIYDYGNSFVDNQSFWLSVQIKQKIKILRRDGIARGEFEVKLYKGKSSKEKILNIKGTTYNLENDKIVETELKPSAIFEEENDDYTLVKFVLPNVQIGSVIAVSYETQSRFMSKFQPWYFQGPDPTLYSEYNTSIPGNYEYNIKLVGGLPLHTNESKIEKDCIKVGHGGGAHCFVSKYVMKNIPAYKPEGYTTTALNYIARIEYELSVIRGFEGGVDKITKTWEDVENELKSDKNFGKQLSKKSLAKNILPESITAMDKSLAKARKIRQYVLDTYKWNGKIERYDVSIKDLLKENSGSVFEINLLLENLLTNEGFEVFPVLMSTRSRGLATKIYPVLTEFNYVILKTNIEGADYFLDATDPYLSFGELPFKCLNQYGRLIDFENRSFWQDIVVDKPSLRHHRVNLNAFENDMFSGHIQSLYTGYHAHNLKQKYHKNPTSYKENKVNSNPYLTINNHEVIEFDYTNYDLNEKMDISVEAEYIGNKVYLDPFIIKFFDENPFKLQERTYPIDFGYKDTYSFVMLIDLGERMKIIETPESISYTLPDNMGTFLFNVLSNENQLTIFFKVNFNEAIYPSELYESLKSFMNKIVETQNNTIIVLEEQ